MKKHIAPLIWIVAGVLLCVFFARMNAGVETTSPSQLWLFYGSLLTFMGGLVTRTVLFRADNASSINYGYKLLGEAILILAILAALVRALCF